MKLPYTLALLLLPASLCQAQESALGLEELMHAALQQNADVQSQAGEQRIAELKERQALTSLLPQLDGEASYLKTSGRADLPDLVGANGLREKVAWLAVRQRLFDAETWSGIAGAQLDRGKQALLYSQKQQEVLLQVVEAYFSALQARGGVEALTEELEAFRLLYDQSQSLYTNGVVPELDVKKSRVQYLLQQHELARARMEYQSALNHVKELVGAGIGDSLALQPFPDRAVRLDSLPVYLRAAAAQRPEMQIALLEAGERRNERRAALLEQLPAAEAGSYYGWDTADPLSAAHRGWQVYVELHLPIWHWGSMQLDRQIATLRSRQGEVLRQQLWKQIAQEVTAAFAECQVQQQQLGAMQESEGVAEEAVRMARLGYQEGTVTELDLVNTQKLLTQTRMEHLQVEYALYAAKARLCRSTGKLEEGFSWLE